MGNRSLMTIIIVLLLGIFTILLIQVNEDSPSEEVGEQVSETIEEIGDEIDDNTTE